MKESTSPEHLRGTLPGDRKAVGRELRVEATTGNAKAYADDVTDCKSGWEIQAAARLP